MPDFDSIGRRLKECREAAGLLQADFASAVAAAGARGATRQTQSIYEKGERMPDAGYLAVADELGIDVLYVLTGRREAQAPASTHLPAALSPVTPDTPQPGAPAMGGATAVLSSGLLVAADAGHSRPLRLPVTFQAGDIQQNREYQVIPRFRAAASAGRPDARQVGADEMTVDMAGVLAMDRTFMRDQLGSDKPGFVTVAVKGDSMERTLIDGETIVIDTDINEIDSSGIYVVQAGKALLVKRLVPDLDGSVIVRSDNPTYARDERRIAADQLHTLRVIGRMVWPKFR